MDGENSNGQMVDAAREDEIRRLPRDSVGDTRAAGNTPVPDKSDDAPVNPLAYRDKHANLEKRARFAEQIIVDHFFGGDVRRFDQAAGLDLDA